MNKSRLEAFSDGVFAIIITIMVLELKIPASTEWEVMKHLVPVFSSYVMSFVFVAIYWGNHHHLMHTLKKVNASVMWANMHLLFWLSLVPFFTGWMGENNFNKIAVAAYGCLLLMCGIAYTILSKTIKNTYKQETPLTIAITKSDAKGYISVLLYTFSIPMALYVHPLVSAACFVAVSIMWLVPSKQIEQALETE
jgi:uncharacterized membrane protein